ncbi:MAG: hypothetical protein IKH67_04620 [Lachnospiraceae bacterium]|nr:hypothetical protein [Lachnospiraceae bacterium]MBR6350693.1 hypothetical protein [Lachnospiraceae bacterium]
MKKEIYQDERNWTFVEWELEDVTAHMLDWFWCNMEKFDVLWHPNQHYGCEWMKGRGPMDLGTMLGTIHIAPQKWNDGKLIRPYIRMERMENVPEEVRDIIKYDHVLIAGGDGAGNISEETPDGMASSWRVHQWQATDKGVVGMSAGMNRDDNSDDESGLIWAQHASEEVGNWENTLPEFYRIYKVVKNKDICPFYSFKVEGKGRNARYIDMK